MRRKIMIALLALPPLTLAAYFLAPVLLFDSDRAAYVSDEERYEQTDLPVALGPKPRFEMPREAQFYYTEDQFIFQAYWWHCRRWRDENGYAPPMGHSDRRSGYPKPH